MYVLALSDYKQPAAAAGYKPAPQLTRPPIRPINCSLYPIVVILSAIGHYGIKSSLFFRTFAFRIKNVRHKAIDYQ